MEIISVSLENTIDGMFYHQDADLVSKKKININSFLSIAQQLYSKFFPSRLMICVQVNKGWLAYLNGNGKIWEVYCLIYKIFSELLSPLWPVVSFAI